jgi:hypothetical protein
MKKPFIFLLALLLFGSVVSASTDSPPDKDDIGYIVADVGIPHEFLAFDAVSIDSPSFETIPVIFYGTPELANSEIINPLDFAYPHKRSYRQVKDLRFTYKKSIASIFAPRLFNHSSGGLPRLCA